MSFINGLIVASMFSSNGKHSVRLPISPMTWGDLEMLLISVLIISYIVAILVKRDMLKDDVCSILEIFETKQAKIKRRINTLNEKPKFFLSPLWIARFTLKQYIKTELIKLNNLNQH